MLVGGPLWVPDELRNENDEESCPAFGNPIRGTVYGNEISYKLLHQVTLRREEMRDDTRQAGASSPRGDLHL